MIVVVVITETEFVRGVNNDVMNDRRDYDY